MSLAGLKELLLLQGIKNANEHKDLEGNKWSNIKTITNTAKAEKELLLDLLSTFALIYSN